MSCSQSEFQHTLPKEETHKNAPHSTLGIGMEVDSIERVGQSNKIEDKSKLTRATVSVTLSCQSVLFPSFFVCPSPLLSLRSGQ